MYVTHVDAPGSHACIREGMLNRCAARPLRALTTFLQPPHARAWLCCRPIERFPTVRHPRAERSHPHPWILLLRRREAQACERNERRQRRLLLVSRVEESRDTENHRHRSPREDRDTLNARLRALLDFVSFHFIIRFRARVLAGIRCKIAVDVSLSGKQRCRLFENSNIEFASRLSKTTTR